MPGRIAVHYPAGTGVIYQPTLGAALIGTNAVIAAKISAQTITGVKLSAGCIIQSKLGAAAVGNAAISVAAIRAAGISAGTVTNAKLSSPESVYPLQFAVDKVPANLSRQSVLLGWMPLAAIPMKLVVTARDATVNKVNLWPVNAAGSVMCATTFTPTGGALTSASPTVNALAAGERIRLWAKASTTTSALGVNVTLWCKSNLTT